jgi:polyisoprenoid-binding protein YceI
MRFLDRLPRARRKHALVRRTAAFTRLQAKLMVMMLVVPLAAPAGAQITFHFDDAQGRNQVEFQSKTPLETFEGKTSRLTGSVSFDPADVSTMTGRLAVDLASLDTGIGLRDSHMRGQVLHCEKYPEAVLAITSVLTSGSPALQNGQPMTAKVLGDLTLHGVTKPVTADVVATWRQASSETAKRGPGDLLDVEARFAVKLSEFGMPRPQMLVMKVSDEIRLTIRATASSVKPAEPAQPQPGR